MGFSKGVLANWGQTRRGKGIQTKKCSQIGKGKGMVLLMQLSTSCELDYLINVEKKIHYTNTRLEIQLSPKEIKKLDYGVTGLE